MAMKIMLDAPAVRALLSVHPEIEAELKKGVAENIAHALALKMTPERVNEAVDRAFAVAIGAGGFTKALSGPMKEAIAREAKEAVGKAIESASTDIIHRVITRLEERQEEAFRRLQARIGDMADERIRARIHSLLSLPAAKDG